MEEPPLNAAHDYAARAEEYAEKGMFDRAAEFHKKAADNYLKAQENTENPEALHALSLLHAQNLAQYQHYSSLPKSTTTPARPTQPQPQRKPQRQSRQRSLPKAYHSVTSSTASFASMVSHARAPPIREDGSMLLVNRFPPNQYPPSTSPQQVSPPSSQASNSPTESTASSASNTANDSRDRFLAVVNQLNAHFSSYALAFARAPVDGTPLPAEYGGESFFDVGEHLANGARGMDDTIVAVTRSMAGTMIAPSSAQAQAGPNNGGRRTKTLEEYEVENQHLKMAVDQLARKVASFQETALQSSEFLKNSIAQLRQAHRQERPNASQQQQEGRIKELESEVRRLTMENTKVKADLEKAQRRWEKLKEGARRRRKEGSAEATGEADTPPPNQNP